MSDQDLRTLERAVESSPDDPEAIRRYAAALTRAGRGWHGENLVPILPRPEGDP